MTTKKAPAKKAPAKKAPVLHSSKAKLPTSTRITDHMAKPGSTKTPAGKKPSATVEKVNSFGLSSRDLANAAIKAKAPVGANGKPNGKPTVAKPVGSKPVTSVPGGPAVGNLKYDYYKTPNDFLKQLTPDQRKYLGEDVSFANEQSQYTTNLRDYNNDSYLTQGRTNDDMLKALSNLGYKGAYATSGPKDATGDYSAFHTGINTAKAHWDPTDENSQYGGSVHDIRNQAAAGGGIGDGYYLKSQADNQRRFSDQASSIIQATQRANADAGHQRTAQNNSVNGLIANSRISALQRINAKYAAQVTTPGV